MSRMPTAVRSFAKINLGLAVGPPRGDGFHPLVTCYQTIALHDLVTVGVTLQPPGPSQITLDCVREGKPAAGVPQTATGDAEKNTAWRMVAGALRQLGVSAKVSVQIDKRLPVQGGLGAGSANAAAALIAFERELQPIAPDARLSAADRLALAAEVGSDVPLFLLGGTILGEGRGEIVTQLPDSAGDAVAVSCVVAVPEVGVSTALAFAALDRRYAGPLTSGPVVDKLEGLSRELASAFGRGASGPSGISSMTLEPMGVQKPAQAQGVDGDLAENPLLRLVRTGIENDFEEVAFSQHPFLRDYKQELVGEGSSGAVYAALSGSGSALFGLYRSQADAVAAQHRLQRAGAVAFATETLPHRAYWERMFVD
jgi:4-diphosphocytidyl-2-C-methyl-D-erythritol kinase